MQRNEQTHIQIETRFTRDYFFEGKVLALAENVQNLQFLRDSISWNCISLFLEVLFFLWARNI